jgi:hypothetical protein
MKRNPPEIEEIIQKTTDHLKNDIQLQRKYKITINDVELLLLYRMFEFTKELENINNYEKFLNSLDNINSYLKFLFKQEGYESIDDFFEIQLYLSDPLLANKKFTLNLELQELFTIMTCINIALKLEKLPFIKDAKQFILVLRDKINKILKEEGFTEREINIINNVEISE